MWLRTSAKPARVPAWFSALAALLLAFGGNAASSAHWLLVPHELCQVHGAWEHASAIAETHTAAETVPTYHSPGASHEECAFATLARPEQLIGTSVPHAIGRLQIERADPIVISMVLERPIPPLSFAPKHSPPA